MKNLYICFLVALIVNNVSADELHMKDGTIIQGTLTKKIPGQSYQMLLSDGSEKTYAFDEVGKVQFSSVPSDSSNEVQTSVSSLSPTNEPTVVPAGGLTSATSVVIEKIFFSFYGAVQFALASEIEDPEPFAGIGAALQRGNFRGSLEVLAGKAKIYYFNSYGSLIGEEEVDDILVTGMLDYIFSDPLKLTGPYVGAGIGVMVESIDGLDRENFLAGELLCGYRGVNSTTAIVKIIGYPDSDNTSLGCLIGLGFMF